MPASWRQIPARGGVEVRDPVAHRRVFFSEILFPASAGLSPDQAIDRVMQRVRPRLAASDLGVQLGPVVRRGSEVQPEVSFLSTANQKSIASAVVARKADDAGVRLISVTYEEDIPSVAPACIDSHASAIVARIEVSTAPVGSAQGPSSAAVVHFAPAATAELGRQMKPDDTVWIAASRAGGETRYQLELRTPDDLPADALRDRVDGIPVAFDRSSLGLVDGATIDFSSEGGGFVFSNPRP